jgi:hypothetical protein
VQGIYIIPIRNVLIVLQFPADKAEKWFNMKVLYFIFSSNSYCRFIPHLLLVEESGELLCGDRTHDPFRMVWRQRPL